MNRLPMRGSRARPALRDEELLDAPAEGTALDPRRVAPAWGWRRPGGGRSSHVAPAVEYQGTTSQVCGLFPFVAGSGAPHIGVPIGRHIHWGQVVSLEPFGWLHAGLVTNPGVFILGEPGVGKALDCTTPIPTPAGWSTMADLKPGDCVFDEHGQPTAVVAVSDVMIGRECFEVEFSDGSVIVADADHLWVTDTVADRLSRYRRSDRQVKRQPLGSPREVLAVHAAVSSTSSGDTTAVQELARELGWQGSGPVSRLYESAKRLERLPQRSNGGFRYDRQALLVETLRRLVSPWNDQRWRTPPKEPVTTRQIRDSLHSGNGKLNHRVAASGPLQLSDADLSIDPRAFGLWLGDGHSASGSFTTADVELLDVFQSAGFQVTKAAGPYAYNITSERRTRVDLPCEVCGTVISSKYAHRRFCSRQCAGAAMRAGAAKSPSRNCAGCGLPLARSSIGLRCAPCWSKATFAGRLRQLGVLGNKHIPAIYLRASEPQRKALLAGLLDTDGTVSPSGQVQFTSCSARLAKDVFELVVSLGFRPALRSRPAKLNGKTVGIAWIVAFTTTETVFGLARKVAVHAARTRGNGARTSHRYIVDVRPVPSVPVRCIQVANPSGMFLAGRSMVPTHNSSLAKRLLTGMASFGIRSIVLGDVKPDYARLVSCLGGQVIRVGRGLDRINPLDSGPLGTAITRLRAGGHSGLADQLLAELRGRRIALLAALCALGRAHQPVTPGEEVLLGAAIDHLTRTLPAGTDPTIPQVLDVIRAAPDQLVQLAEVSSAEEFHRDSKLLRQTLRLLCEGSLRGMFDGPTTTPLDLDAPAIDVDISAVANGGEDIAVAAAMLCSWAYGFGVVDAALALAEVGLAPRRNYVAFLDELWRALRGAPGLVDRADTLTRVNRQKGMGQIMLTHSLADLEALPTEADRAKARGFVERCGITILAGLPPRELAALGPVVGHLSAEERRMVSSWSTPTSWAGGQQHPGRGKYLIKAGLRSGIPVELEYVADEADVYDTDAAVTANLAPHKGLA